MLLNVQPKTQSIAYSIMLILLLNGVGFTELKVASTSRSITTIILIRHAERDNFFTITNQGRERAEALVNAVKDFEITAIYSPDRGRNLDMVRPLADHLKIDITLTPRITKPTVDKIKNEIATKHAGEVVLLVGNGPGNLRSLHHRLGGQGDGPDQYGELFIYIFTDHSDIHHLILFTPSFNLISSFGNHTDPPVHYNPSVMSGSSIRKMNGQVVLASFYSSSSAVFFKNWNHNIPFNSFRI